MKILTLIGLIVAVILVIAGWCLILVEQKKGKKSKTGYLLNAIGSSLLAIYFICKLVL